MSRFDREESYRLAHAYFAKGQFSDGVSELKRVVDLQPENSKARMELGAVYLRQEQPKEAQEEFAKLVAEFKKSK